jgi:hypothetical protein
MPAEALRGWMDFYEVEPFGPVQEDRRAGYLASLLCSSDPPKKPEFWFPSLANTLPLKFRRRQTVEEQILEAKRLCVLMGGKIQ